jgi:hypothetical protein
MAPGLKMRYRSIMMSDWVFDWVFAGTGKIIGHGSLVRCGRMTNSVITSWVRRAIWPKPILLFLGLAVPLLAPPGAWAQHQGAGSATSPDGKVRVDILSLKRTEGDTVTLRFQVTNDSNDGYLVTMDNMRLIDIAGRRVYSPGVTSKNCSTPIGQQLTCYAIFGAPPAGTKTMAVQFYEKMDLITGVPVSE